MSVLHLRSGSKCPPYKSGTLRLYSQKYCPFSQTTRMVLAHKGVEYKLVNVHTKDKPEWYFEKSPLGKTPSIEIEEGKVVYDSTICNYYLDAVYPQNKLIPDDPFQRAEMEMWIERYNSTVHGPYSYCCWTEATPEKLAEAQKGLEAFEKLLTDGRQFFGGEKVNLLDIKTYSMLEKADYIKEVRGVDPVPEKRFPKIRAWRERMGNTAAGKGGCTDLANLVKMGVGADGLPDYDVGVKA